MSSMSSLKLRRSGARLLSCVALFVSAGVLLHSKPAHACLWDDEVFLAEEQRMPCFSRVVTGTFPRHASEYYATRLRAAELLLAVDPTSPDALDMVGVAQLKLAKFADAERTMLRRAEAFPDAYASAANLGTLYTFNGQLEKALPYIDKAMAIEPNAHFGRERYHKLFVQYLLALKADPKKAKDNFLGVPVAAADIAAGSAPALDAKLAAAGLSRDAFEALDAMITVYGAAENPYLYAAAGDLLALDGNLVYAAIAYRAAVARKHPERAQLTARAAEFEHRKGLFNVRPDGITESPGESGAHKRAIAEYLYAETHPEMNPGAIAPRALYAKYEAQQLARGLAVWTQAGMVTLYAEQNRLKTHCPVGKLFDDPDGPPLPPAATSSVTTPAPATSNSGSHR
jgi:tetratricopeptide (TPR) repeat protein